MPVSERTCWARKPARSALARALLSSTENSQMPTKPIAIENRAGEVYGNSAEPLGLPSVASHTDGDTTVSATDEIRPEEAADHRALGGAVFPQHAHEEHREVGRGRDREGQGHHEGDVLLLERDAQRDREDAQRTVVMRETLSSEALSALPCLITVA